MEIFYREKASHAGNKIMKNDFAPSEKFSCYAPDRHLPSIMQYLYEFVWDS